MMYNGGLKWKRKVIEKSHQLRIRLDERENNKWNTDKLL